MKRFALLLICLITLLPALLGQGLFVSWNRFAPRLLDPAYECGWDGNYLVQQDFEGAGYDNGETWTEAGGSTIDEDYTGVVLDGLQSLRYQGGQVDVSFAAQDEVWIYFKLRFVTMGTGNPQWLGWLNTGEATIAFNINSGSAGLLGMCGSVCSVPSATLTTGTTYHIWAHYKKGTGANEIHDIAWSTDGIKPTSGTQFAQITTGSRTAQINLLRLGWSTDSGTREWIFDKVRVANTCIGSNPP